MEQQSVFATLGVDWKLLIAQLVNFGIVVFVVWKWIAVPLTKTLQERQNKIESSVKAADEMKQKIAEAEERRIVELKKLRVEADELIRQAQSEAEQIQMQTIADAQKEAVKLIDQAKALIENDRQKMLKEVREELATLVVMAAEKVLGEKLDNKKDQELIQESIKGLRIK